MLASSTATKLRRMFAPTGQLKKEKEFFKNHPQLIGLSGDLPEKGSYLALDDFGVPILATRDKDGQFRAFLNACRHRGARLASEPKGRASVFMCPFHQWSYAPTGELINIPNEDHFGAVIKTVADLSNSRLLSITGCCLFTQTKMAR